MEMDYYKILGTSREAIYYKGLNKGRRTNKEIDEFIEEKYKHSLKWMEERKSRMTSKPEIEAVEQQIELLTFAYNQVRSAILREMYHQQLDKEKQVDKRNKVGMKKETAYDVLNTTEEAVQRRTEKENDQFLRERRDQLHDYYKTMLDDSSNYSDRSKIELMMQKIMESYQKVMTAEKRKIYQQQLQQERQEEENQIRKQEIKEKYSHTAEFNPSLIAKAENLIEARMVVRQKTKEQAEEHVYTNKENQKIKVKQTGNILFKNTFGAQLQVSEYEITRKIEEQEKKDSIYTDSLVFPELSQDKKTGKPINPKYYDCVINQLLSEEMIEGAKYNGGYIGEITQDEQGNYFTTLGERKLKPREQEILAAIMILQNEKQKENQSLEGETR